MNTNTLYLLLALTTAASVIALFGLCRAISHAERVDQELGSFKRETQRLHETLNKIHERGRAQRAALTEDVRLRLINVTPVSLYIAVSPLPSCVERGYPPKTIGYTLNQATAARWAREGLKVQLRVAFEQDGHVYFHDAIDAQRVTKLES